ncbi:MAG TPA: hypothetical protein VIM61_01435 [Chthoniobacterales bacterium]
MRLVRSFFLPIAFAAGLVGCRPSPPVDARLASPIELAKEAAPQKLERIFANARAKALLAGQSLAFAPERPDDAAALQSPSTWRRLDRADRFDAVLLAGPAGEFQPLLSHLVTSPDFRLVRVDNWGALFVRGTPAAYTPPPPGSVARDLSDADRGAYLARMALMLQAVDEVAAAKAYSAAALDTAPKEPIVHVAAAALALTRKDYQPALKQVQQALALNPHDLGALEIAARTFTAAGAADQAWAVATELKSRAPADDMNVLFLHARLASAAHAYSAEQDSLERLIALAEKQNLPTGDYRVYLGQCFAHQGLPRPALEQLELAAKAPNLSDQQRADLDTAISTVRERAGQLSQ